MNRTPFAIALAFALVGAGLLYLYKQRLESETAGGRRVPVLMARRGISMGARIVEEDVGIRYLPEAYIDDRHIRSTEMQTVIGVRAGNEIRPNESILWTDVASSAQQGRKLSSLVRPGMRGVAVAFEAAFGGLLRPGDRVDVLMTQENPVTRLRQTQVFEQNLLVLAVNNDFSGESAGKGPTRGTLATLAVTSDQGQRLTLGQLEGRLSMLLRNPEDLRTIDDIPETRSADLTVRVRGALPAFGAATSSSPGAEPSRPPALSRRSR